MLKTIAAALAVVFAAGASFAATETFTFSGYYKGNGWGYYDSMRWTGDAGGSVDVSAGYVYKGKLHASTVGHWKGGGLGACNEFSSRSASCREQHTVDGAYKRDDYLKFSLGNDATITKITFSHYGRRTTEFVLHANGTSSKENYGWSRADRGFAWYGDVHGGSMFFVGAKHKKSAFKVKSITVDYKMSPVPLPAAGFLLLGGLGGLMALKRRKTS